MTENIEEAEVVKTDREKELEAEIAALRAKESAVEKVAPELSTRDRSPVKPQDHQRKQDPASLTDGTVEVSYQGKTFRVEFEGLDDADLFAQDENNPFVAAKSIMGIIGRDGYMQLADIVRDENGKAKMSVLQEKFGEIMQDAAAKNS